MIPQRIVVIGASTVYGRVDIEGGGWVGRLRRWHEQQDRKNAVFNLGIGGDTSEGFLRRLKVEVSPRRPDLILVSGGLNDIKRVSNKTAPVTIPLPQSQQNIREIIKEGRKLTEVIFISVHPIDESRTSPVSWENSHYLSVDVRQYSDATKEICETEKIPYIDIFNEWMKINYMPLLADDGLHPNSHGHQKIFEAVREFLIEKYNKNLWPL